MIKSWLPLPSRYTAKWGAIHPGLPPTGSYTAVFPRWPNACFNFNFNSFRHRADGQQHSRGAGLGPPLDQVGVGRGCDAHGCAYPVQQGTSPPVTRNSVRFSLDFPGGARELCQIALPWVPHQWGVPTSSLQSTIVPSLVGGVHVSTKTDHYELCF